MKHRYTWAQILLHWLTLVMLILTYSAMLLRESASYAYYTEMTALHFNFGSVVWLLMLIRLSLRFFYPAPVIRPLLPVWQRRAAVVGHGLIYLLYLALPVLGFLVLAYSGKEWVWLGWPVPDVVIPDLATATLLKDTHTRLASLGYILIGIHTIAALYHHYVRRDNTLLRILPQHNRAEASRK